MEKSFGNDRASLFYPPSNLDDAVDRILTKVSFINRHVLIFKTNCTRMKKWPAPYSQPNFWHRSARQLGQKILIQCPATHSKKLETTGFSTFWINKPIQVRCVKATQNLSEWSVQYKRLRFAACDVQKNGVRLGFSKLG